MTPYVSSIARLFTLLLFMTSYLSSIARLFTLPYVMDKAGYSFPVLFRFFSSPFVPLKKNKKSARERAFLCACNFIVFHGGYLPSRVFGFNNLLFFLPLYLVFDISASLYGYY